MNIEKLKQAIEIAALLDDEPTQSSNGDGRAVIVRSRDAGVLFGEFAGNEGSKIHLKNAVQMWKWKAEKGGTLLDCAEFGVTAKECKFSPAKGTVTVFNACALIDCSDASAKSIRSVKGGLWS